MCSYFSSLVAVAVLAIAFFSPAAARPARAASDAGNHVAWTEPVALTDDNAVAQDEPANVLFAGDAALVEGSAKPQVAGTENAVMAAAAPNVLIDAPADLFTDGTADVYADAAAEAEAAALQTLMKRVYSGGGGRTALVM